MCDVSSFKRDEHIWASYIEENESTIVSETQLEAYLVAQGVDTVHKRQAEHALRKIGYATEC